MSDDHGGYGSDQYKKRRVMFDSKTSGRGHPDYDEAVDEKGPGDPDCPHCFGHGFVQDDSIIPPGRMRCECTAARDILDNVESGWRGLSRAANIESSPLMDMTEDNVWVTAPTRVFREHLRHVAIRKGDRWFFKVASDTDLITAWLATVPLGGGEIFDSDAAPVSMSFYTLQDLVVPPELLIIHLGMKAANNKEMPGVLMEALSSRFHEGKPTWLFDQPHTPLSPGHLCYSDHLMDHIQMWEYFAVDLDDDREVEHPEMPPSVMSEMSPPVTPGTVGFDQELPTQNEPVRESRKSSLKVHRDPPKRKKKSSFGGGGGLSSKKKKRQGS